MAFWFTLGGLLYALVLFGAWCLARAAGRPVPVLTPERRHPSVWS